MASSTIGYRTEIAEPHPEQRPRRKIHARTGTFSHGRTRCPQDGHEDGGLTTDMPRGRRWITTFRKLPTQLPKTRVGR